MTDTPHLGCQSVDYSISVSYTNLPIPQLKKGKHIFTNQTAPVATVRLPLRVVFDR